MGFLLKTHSLGSSGGRNNKRFWSTLLELDEEIEVSHLDDKDVQKAVKGYYAAFENDPLMRYTAAGEELTSRQKVSRAVIMSLAFRAWIRSKIAITVNQGASVVLATPASTERRTPKEWILDWTVTATLKILDQLSRQTQEQRKRRKELIDKSDAVISRQIGGRTKEMIYVNLVVTEPGSQGHGYASALLETITRLAETFGQACWLMSSNIANEGFYNHHGFKSVGDAILGDDNPTWNEKPVVVQIMVREPKI